MPLKLTLLSTVLSVVFSASACGFWGPSAGKDGEPAITPETVSNIPFLTKEPDRYQADIVVTAYEAGKAVVSRRFTFTKRGTEVAVVFEPGSDDEWRLVSLDDGREITVDPKRRSYEILDSGPVVNPLAKELTQGWLTVTPGTKFEKLSTEGGISRYRVSAEGLQRSETIVTYDEARKFPVGTDIYSLKDGRKELAFKYEITDFKDQADDGLFQIPEGFKEKPVKKR